jgi:hypothetical protein
VGAAAQPPAATASAAPETSGDRQQQQARRRTPVENVELSSHVSTEQEMNHEQAHDGQQAEARSVFCVMAVLLFCCVLLCAQLWGAQAY